MCHSSYWYSINVHEVSNFCRVPRSVSQSIWILPLQDSIGFNPFNTIGSWKIVLFKKRNVGMLIGGAWHHEFMLQKLLIKHGSAGYTPGFQQHQLWFVSWSPDGYYTCSDSVYTLDFCKIYLKIATLIVNCVRVFTDWDLIWCQAISIGCPLPCWL